MQHSTDYNRAPATSATPHVWNCLPNSKANTPTTPCIKATKQMATYVATPGDFAAPFVPVKNAILLFKHSSHYTAVHNTFSYIETTIVKPAKKSSAAAPTRHQHAPMALTPVQESAVISCYLFVADQERLQCINVFPNNGSTTSYEHESTKMDCTNSLFQASNKINHNAKNKLENDITRRITFSPIIPSKRNPQFAYNKRPSKKK